MSDTLPRSGEALEIPVCREHLIRAAMQILGDVYERTGIPCDYDLSAFPRPVLKWEQADPLGHRAAFMVSQASKKMGFRENLQYSPERSRFGTQVTRSSVDYYFNDAHPAYIALLLIHRATTEPDPIRGLEILDFTDEWLAFVTDPPKKADGKRYPPVESRREPDGPLYLKRVFHVREDLDALLSGEKARTGVTDISEVLNRLLTTATARRSKAGKCRMGRRSRRIRRAR